VTVNNRLRGRLVQLGGGLILLAAGLVVGTGICPRLHAAPPWLSWWHHPCDAAPCEGPPGEFEGTWYWMHSSDQEKRVIMARYNRYCVRCHGVDGRGVWDIPGIPDFTDPHFQTSRTNGQIAYYIIEGRRAVMPPFRGTLTVGEAWQMAHYLRTFVPGLEVSRPEMDSPKKSGQAPEQIPAPREEPAPLVK
jgi:mono/diheme cytochrome c family protein